MGILVNEVKEGFGLPQMSRGGEHAPLKLGPGRKEADRAFAEEELLRRRAKESAAGVVSAAGQSAADLKEAGEGGKKAIRQRAAQAIAGTHGQVGALQGGGAAAGLRQTALDRGAAEAEFGLQQTTAQNQANIFAEQSKVDQVLFEKEMGNLAGDRREKMGVYGQTLDRLIEAYDGNQQMFETEVFEMLDNEGDPVIRQQLLARARAILDEEFGVGTDDLNDSFDKRTSSLAVGEAGQNAAGVANAPLGL